MDQMTKRVAPAAPMLRRLARALAVTGLVAMAAPAIAVDPAAGVAQAIAQAREACNVKRLTRVSVTTMCETFDQYGRGLSCVADRLRANEKFERQPILGVAARCYEQLGEALQEGRGADPVQVNGFEELCRSVRHATPEPRNALPPDLVLASAALLLPAFSRNQVTAPQLDTIGAVQFRAMPECAVATALPPPAPAAGAGSGARAGAEAAVSTASVRASNDVALASLSMKLPDPPANAGPAGGRAGDAPDANGIGGKSDAVAPKSDARADQAISEAAVINALPVASAPRRDRAAREARASRAARPTRVATTARQPESTRVAAAPAVKPVSDKPDTNAAAGFASGYSPFQGARSDTAPPALPLMGPPTRPAAMAPLPPSAR